MDLRRSSADRLKPVPLFCRAVLATQVAQYKTEKWFQAELLFHLRKSGRHVISEYGPQRWDISIRPNERAQQINLLALDCLPDSAQNAGSIISSHHELRSPPRMKMCYNSSCAAGTEVGL
jgi:hypothetical protein